MTRLYFPQSEVQVRHRPATPADHTEADALFTIGLKDESLRVYELLLEHPAAKPSDLASVGELPLAHVRRLLGELEEKGLVTRTPERVASYCAVAPELALGAIVARHQTGLQGVRALAERLARIRPPKNAEEPGELSVELITGRDALMRVIGQLYASAQEEILEFDRPPYVNTFEGHSAMHVAVHERGIACRTVVDATALDDPNRARNVYRCAAEGEDIRLYEGVPIKAAIVDRRIALVPLHLKNVNESGLLLRPSLVLDTLCAHFDLLWQDAVPMAGVDAHDMDDGRSEAAELEKILAMLATGMKDKQIADRLQLSQRTFDRRVSSLSKKLKAGTRFQAGWNAAIRATKDIERNR